MPIANRSQTKHARDGLAVVETTTASLHAWDRNPRRISATRLEQLKAMLTASPEMLHARPLIVLPDGTVIAGNQRLVAVRELGWETVPAVCVDLDPATAARWALADNNQLGEEDEELTAQLLAELGAADVDLLLTGYAPDDTARLLASLNRRDADPDAVPEVPAVPRSTRGEVYELGPHRLMCGDATSAEDIATLLGDARIAVLVTDPPYGIGVDHRWREAAGKSRLGTARGSIEGDDRHEWGAVYALIPALIAYVWCSPLHAGVVQAELVAAGYEVRQQIVWAKAVFAIGRSAYQWKHETAWYAVRKGANANWRGGRAQTTVWAAASPIHIFGGGGDDVRTSHPTQKPVSIFAPPIENHTSPGDIVCDPFSGAGTALIAAEQLGRCCLAMEIDPRFCDVARQRYANYVDDQTWAP